MTPPLGTLEYLYVGTADFDRDCAYYANVLGAERAWAFNAFGARVAAFRVCQGPLFLLADHRPAPRPDRGEHHRGRAGCRRRRRIAASRP